MVAIIKHGRSVSATFYYNENKVSEGVANCLMAENYPLELDRLNELMRLGVLEKVAALRPDIQKPTLHITLNFPPEEQHSESFLKQLAGEYMERIGFGEQPYLVYQHFDAGHPHLHVLTLRVRPDGTNIDTHQIGRKLSEPARKAMEIKHGLVKAEEHNKGLFQLKPVDLRRVEYGMVPTKRAIANILASVLDKYKYTSLNELNAVLRLYNVQAERGQEGGRLHTYRGLIYRVIDAEGKGISAPVKASSFAYKAKLPEIEKRFLRNDVERQQSKPSLRVAIDKALRQQAVLDFPALKEALKRSGVDLVTHQSREGHIYGLTYVDHRNKAVFTGSDLGRNYSAKAIAERLSESFVREQPQQAKALVERHDADTKQADTVAKQTTVYNSAQYSSGSGDMQKSLAELLLQPEYTSSYLPPELRKTRKKKRRKINR